jgi:hypothetical protein
VRRPSIQFAVIAILVLASGCKKKDKPAPTSEHATILKFFEPFPSDPGEVEISRWYSIHLQDQPAGSMHVTVTRHQTKQGPRRVITTREELAIRRGEQRLEILNSVRSLEDEKGRLLRTWHRERQAGGDETEIAAGKVENEMVTLRGPEVLRVPFEDKAFDAQLPYRWVLSRKTLKPGDVYEFRTYLWMSAGYTDNQLEITGAGSARHAVNKMPGVVTTLHFDPSGESILPVRMDTAVGALRLRFELQSGEPPRESWSEAPDLDPLMRVHHDGHLPHRDKVRMARYRIEGLPDHVDAQWLTGPGQKVVAQPSPGVFEIESSRTEPAATAAFPMKKAGAEMETWLGPTATAQSDDPEIRALAIKITGGASDAWEAARWLRRWVSDEVSGNMGMAFASAREVLARRQGDCSEQAVLLAALARAVGIPSRCVMGLVFHDGQFARHMWTEVWTGAWRPLDAAMGSDEVGGAWIRLGEYSLKLTDDRQAGMGGMVAFASNLRVIVVRFDPTDSE